MGDKMTITEALAEVKMIVKRIGKSASIVQANTSRLEFETDPYETKGGSAKVIGEYLQSIRDLGTRLVNIRHCIAEANLRTRLTVQVGEGKIGVSRTIGEWLIWRREVAESEQSILAKVARQATNQRNEARENPRVMPNKDKDATPEVARLILHVDIGDLQDKAAKIEEILGVLDGKLSLLNATTTIEI